MDTTTIIVIAVAVAFAYIALLLGLMSWMATTAAKNTPPSISHIPAQADILQQVQKFALAYGYTKRPVSSHPNEHVFRRGRGWLTSLTDVCLRLNPDDGSAEIEVKEGVNFLYKITYFPINASTFLGLPVRQHKVKKINLLLTHLGANNIAFKKSPSNKPRRIKTHKS